MTLALYGHFFQLPNPFVVETSRDFLKWGYPQNGWFIMENPINNGWFGGTPILGTKTPMWRLQTLNISKQRGRWLRLSSCCCGYGYGCGLGHRISLHLRRHHLGDLICKRNARRCPTAPCCALLRPTSLRIFNFETSTLAATDVAFSLAAFSAPDHGWDLCSQDHRNLLRDRGYGHGWHPCSWDHCNHLHGYGHGRNHWHGCDHDHVPCNKMSRI